MNRRRYCGCECSQCDLGFHCYDTRKGCYMHPRAKLPPLPATAQPAQEPRSKPETKRQRLDRGLGHLAEIKQNLAACQPRPNFPKPNKEQP